MCNKQKIFIGLGFLLIFSIFFYTFEIKEENISLSDSTLETIIYADIVEIDEIDAEVVFNDIFIEDLESTMQNAILTSGSEYIENKLKKEIEERESRLAQAVNIKGDAILSYNPFIQSGLSVEEYDIILKGTGLEGCGESFYRMEKTYNVNGLFAVGVAFHESGYGRHKANTNNFYGMRGNNGWMSFESPDANIQYFGKLMNKSLYKNKSIESIGKIYCPGTYLHWANAVKSMMVSSFNKI